MEETAWQWRERSRAVGARIAFLGRLESAASEAAKRKAAQSARRQRWAELQRGVRRGAGSGSDSGKGPVRGGGGGGGSGLSPAGAAAADFRGGGWGARSPDRQVGRPGRAAARGSRASGRGGRRAASAPLPGTGASPRSEDTSILQLSHWSGDSVAGDPAARRGSAAPRVPRVAGGPGSPAAPGVAAGAAGGPGGTPVVVPLGSLGPLEPLGPLGPGTLLI